MWTTSYINVIYFRYSNMWYCFHIEDNANRLLNCFPTGQFIHIWKKLVWHISKALCVDRASLVPKVVTESACYARHLVSVPGSGSPAERNDYPLQYSCLQNSTDRRGLQKSQNYSNLEKYTESQKIKTISIFAFNIRKLKMF